MGQIDLACRHCHKLIVKVEDERIAGYWAFAIVCADCVGVTDEGICKQCTD